MDIQADTIAAQLAQIEYSTAAEWIWVSACAKDSRNGSHSGCAGADSQKDIQMK